MSKMKSTNVTTKLQSMENECHDLEERVNTLQDQLKREKELQVENLISFEEETRKMLELFKDAVFQYRDSALSGKAELKEMEKKSCQQKVEELESQLRHIDRELASLSLGDSLPHRWDTDIPEPQRNLVLQLLLEERTRFQRQLDRLNVEKAKALSILQTLTSEKI